MQVPYHGSSTAPVSTHDVRLPKESTVGDLLDALMQQLPADKRPKQLRLLEIFNGKIYQVLVNAPECLVWDMTADVSCCCCFCCCAEKQECGQIFSA